MAKKFFVTLAFLCLNACTSTPIESKSTEKTPRAPQSSTPLTRSPEETVAFLADLLSNSRLPENVRKFNRQAAMLCWQNPAWSKISFKDEARKRASKIFLCNVPVQFRWCHTIKFLRIEGELSKGAISPAERDHRQDAAFRECDQGRRTYLQSVYGWSDSSVTLNSATGGELDQLYRVVMRDRQADLSAPLLEALERAHPKRVFGLSERELNGKLNILAAIGMTVESRSYGVQDSDIVDLIEAMIKGALSWQ